MHLPQSVCIINLRNKGHCTFEKCILEKTANGVLKGVRNQDDIEIHYDFLDVFFGFQESFCGKKLRNLSNYIKKNVKSIS